MGPYPKRERSDPVADPVTYLLGYHMGFPAIVEYWRSFDHLEAFANDADDPHVAVWRNYWKRVGTSSRTGIWHETYLVRAAAACSGRRARLTRREVTLSAMTRVRTRRASRSPRTCPDAISLRVPG